MYCIMLYLSFLNASDDNRTIRIEPNKLYLLVAASVLTHPPSMSQVTPCNLFAM